MVGNILSIQYRSSTFLVCHASVGKFWPDDQVETHPVKRREFMHQNYSQPIEPVSVSEGILQEQLRFSSWLWIISLYLTLVIISILAMLILIALSLM